VVLVKILMVANVGFHANLGTRVLGQYVGAANPNNLFVKAENIRIFHFSMIYKLK
jgi:hypothetical protein